MSKQFFSIYFIFTSLILFAATANANPGQYQINSACIDSGCFTGDNPATKTIEITLSSGTFVLTSDIVFTDVDNGDPAILINNVNNASKITIDLNGYSIRHSGIANSSTYGIRITGQNSVVSIKNGNIIAFYDGVLASSGAVVHIENMRFRIQRDDAIELSTGVIKNNIFDSNGYAINAFNATNTASDRLYIDSNYFISDSGDQIVGFSMSTNNFCKDNMVGYPDTNNFQSCTLVGNNMCDTGPCTASSIQVNEQKE